MSQIPDIATLLATKKNEGEMRDQVLVPLAAVLAETPGGAAESELTISTGSITPTAASHTVDTEADAASDDLANILTTNHPEGRIIFLRLQDAARVVTVKHEAGGAGQVHLMDSADLALSATRQLALQRRGTDWYEVRFWPSVVSLTTLTASSQVRTTIVTSNSTSNVNFKTSGGTSLAVGHQANMVNNLVIYGGAAGGSCLVDSVGTDTDVSLQFRLKGAGNLSFYSGGGTYQQFGVTHTASAVNRVSVTGAATGGAPSFSASGSDSDIDILFTPKGSGRVRFGTHAALSGESVSGYITIKDAGGTSRKLAVVS
jgi:hypothetical protein